MHSVRGPHAKSSTLGLVLAILGLGAVAIANDARDYNLQFVIVQISQQKMMETRGAYSRYYYRGSGYANLRNGQSIEGVHFEFTECDGGLVSSTPEERVLPARWVKEREKLAVIDAPSNRP